MARASTFLIVVIFITGIVGCGDATPVDWYTLNISSSEGGEVITPGEGTFNIQAGASVVLEAQPEESYIFINWTGDVATMSDVNAATTSITMNGNYSITAEFVRQYDLTVSSTAGGSVTTPGEGTFAYDAGTMVDLVAEPNEGYYFGEWTGDVDTVADLDDATTTIMMDDNYSIAADFEEYTPVVAAGLTHTVGVKRDGTVVAVGINPYGECNVSDWTDIVQVAAGQMYTVGLRCDGTVVAVGYNAQGQCNVTGWTDIIEVVAGGAHTVGLRSDGTVVAAGHNGYGQCNVTGWTDIIQVAAGEWHTVGVKSDGTVVAVGDNYQGQRNVGSWTDIVQVAAGDDHTVGLRSDGTVVAVGWNNYGQCNVTGWTGIVQVGAGYWHTAGLKADHTVVAVGPETGEYDYGQCDVGNWTDIIGVAIGYWHTVGLKSDGTVVAVGEDVYGQCDVESWDLS